QLDEHGSLTGFARMVAARPRLDAVAMRRRSLLACDRPVSQLIEAASRPGRLLDGDLGALGERPFGLVIAAERARAGLDAEQHVGSTAVEVGRPGLAL